MPLLLLPAALRVSRGRRFALLALLFVLLSLGRHLPGGDLPAHLPIFGGQRYPEKWLGGLFVGLPVPPGRHAVDGRHRNRAFAIGGGIALFALLGVAGAAIAGRRRGGGATAD